jgi:hypothetical protein
MNINQHLSKSIICSWNIKKNKEPNNNYNILSCVFFLKKESYKNINIYKNGIIDIINNFNKILPNFRLRIYYDESVLEILNNILNKKNLDNIELYKYNIDFFRDDIYHKGVIGTFIRFLPLFDLEYHKVDKCLVIDIDNKLYNLHRRIINYFDINNIKFAYKSRFCYSFNKRTSKNKYPIIASLIYQSIQMPYKILSNFLEKIYIDNNSKIINYINKCNISNIYEYGIDEFFLNKYYIKHMNKLNIILILMNYVDIVLGFKQFISQSKKQKTIKNIWIIMINFFKIINIDLNNLYNNDELNKELILDMLKNNGKNLESSLLNTYKKNNSKIFNLKKYILNELKNVNYNKRTIKLLNCIKNNLDININKINLALIKNNNIEYYTYLKFN